MHLSMVSHISSWSPDGTKLVYKPDPKASPKRHTPTQPDHNAIQVSKMQRLSNDKLDEIAQARVVKSCSRADSTAWAFSQVQDADRNVSTNLTKSQAFPDPGWVSETHQKDGSHRHRSRPLRAGSQRQSAHRCIGQQDGRLS